MPIPDDQYTPVPSPAQAIEMEKLSHRVQSGIAFLLSGAERKGERFPECEPKHLRVGVNSALIETSALARLLLAKKIFTAEEYFDMLIKVWRDEVDSYTARVKAIDPRLSI